MIQLSSAQRSLAAREGREKLWFSRGARLRQFAFEFLSPIGIKEPGKIGVMEPDLGRENGHPGGLKNVWI